MQKLKQDYRIQRTFQKRFDKCSHFTPKPWEQLQNPRSTPNPWDQFQNPGSTPKPWDQFQNPESSHPSLVQWTIQNHNLSSFSRFQESFCSITQFYLIFRNILIQSIFDDELDQPSFPLLLPTPLFRLKQKICNFLELET